MDRPRRGDGAKEAQAEAVGGDRAYWLGRARKFVEQGRHDDALRVLERFWPATDGVVSERLRWLVRHWPERLADELAAAGAGPSDDAALTALGERLRIWPDDVFEALARLPALPPAWVAEARARREASARLAAGDDEGARAALRRVPRRSPLQPAQRFLRGLSAWHRRDHDEARLILGALRDDPIYGGSAAALLARDGDPEAAADPALEPWRAALDAGDEAAAVLALTGHVDRALAVLPDE